MIGACVTLMTAGAALANSPTGTLAAYFKQLELDLVSKGGLKTDRGSARSDASSLARDFVDVALTTEYAGGNLSVGEGRRAAKPLLRWEEPVRMQVLFGRSVSQDQRVADRRAIREHAKKLARVTGHPIARATEDVNFHVLVVSEAELNGLHRQLPDLIPGVSPWMVRTLSRMRTRRYSRMDSRLRLATGRTFQPRSSSRSSSASSSTANHGQCYRFRERQGSEHLTPLI